MKNVFVTFGLGVFLLLCACQTEKCEWEKEMFTSEWHYTVAKLYQHEDFKATYVIETKEGIKLLFQPIQRIYTEAEPGDILIKHQNSQEAKLVKMNGNVPDTVEFSRIYSPSCDDIIHTMNLHND